MRLTLLLFALVLPLVSQGTATASIQVSDDPSILHGSQQANITTDTLTGLDWLDPDATLGMSFDGVSLLLQSPAYGGFRYATRDDLRTFFDHLGLPTGPGDWYVLQFDSGAAYDAAAPYFGFTQSNNPNQRITAGMLVEPGGMSNATQYYLGVAVHGDILSVNPHTTSYIAGPVPSDYVQPDVGHWLVRDTPDNIVPEPTTIAIWSLLGFIGIGGSTWRRRRTQAA